MLISVLKNFHVSLLGLVLSPRACGTQDARRTGFRSTGAGPLSLPQPNSLGEAYLVREANISNVTEIPAQRRLTHNWKPFQVLQQTCATSCRVKQLHFRKPQRVIATSVASVLRTVMGDRISLSETVPRSACIGTRPLSGLVLSAYIAGMKPGQTVSGRPLFALAVGAHVPAIAPLPASTCGCKRFKLEMPLATT